MLFGSFYCWLSLFILSCLPLAAEARKHKSPKVKAVITTPGPGDGHGKCTVTADDQVITISQSTAFTKVYKAVPSKRPKGHKPKLLRIDVVEIIITVTFSELGPHAIEGYGGSGLCKDCDPDDDGVESQVVSVKKCTNRVCKGQLQTWRSNPTTSYAYHESPVTTAVYASSTGTQSFLVVPETVAQAEITNAPSIIKYDGFSHEFHETGPQIVTLDHGEFHDGVTIRQPFYHTIHITQATTIYFPACYQSFSHTGHFGITIQPPQYITTYVPVIGPINIYTTITQINNYYTTIISQTIVSGSTLPPVTVTATTTATTTASASAAPTNIDQLIINGKQFRYETCGHPADNANFELAIDSPRMSLELCFAACSSAVRAAVRGTECYCSTAQVASGSDSIPGTCNAACPGDDTEICGGSSGLRKRQTGGDYSIYVNVSNLQLADTTTTSATPTTSPPPNPSVDMDIEPRQIVDALLTAAPEAAYAEPSPVAVELLNRRKRDHGAPKRKRDLGIKGPALL